MILAAWHDTTSALRSRNIQSANDLSLRLPDLREQITAWAQNDSATRGARMVHSHFHLAPTLTSRITSRNISYTNSATAHMHFHYLGTCSQQLPSHATTPASPPAPEVERVYGGKGGGKGGLYMAVAVRDPDIHQCNDAEFTSGELDFCQGIAPLKIPADDPNEGDGDFGKLNLAE